MKQATKTRVFIQTLIWKTAQKTCTKYARSCHVLYNDKLWTYTKPWNPI